MNGAIATNRFGLGATPLEIEKASESPIEYVLAQMKPISFDKVYSSQSIALKMQHFRKGTSEASKDEARKFRQATYRQLSLATLNNAISSKQPFMWRLLDFFSNHFSVTAQGAYLTAISPTLEREAIAPNLLGKFSDMLLSVSRHPAMLIYLNNEKSYGKNSQLGKKGKGLNENLAREILELHTLGVKGGFTQSDVLALANGISGWSIRVPQIAEPELFYFRKAGHEPNEQTLLGHLFSQKDEKQGEAMLRYIAAQPATAKFISEKLVKHFVSDTPPPALLEQVQQTWLKTEGDLKAVYHALVTHPHAWFDTLEKFKTPREFLISTYRGIGLSSIKEGFAMRSLTEMGQAPFKAGSPAGYEDSEDFWNSGYGLIARANWLTSLRINLEFEIPELANRLLGSTLSEHTRMLVSRAESRERAFALLFMSPEFMRR
ncbi:DUF1800 family protein [Alteromonas sp. KUL106]|uniref:DUF1800 domain-containing protein n=1 Tax=Alteromonas sp. KUL106 TaxID=2480799 RepID=UPI0012E4555F|nr:DUF1800 domain-containing protein [Alteromonas sp. KUL106]GFD68587.1 hypothetical protein KUL106_18500 [Alteromonas sp. KUL106]